MDIVQTLQRIVTPPMERITSFMQWLDKHHNLIMWLSAIVYHISLELIYIFAVSPAYAYAGLTLAPHSVKYILSWVFYLLIFYTTPKDENRIGSFCLHLQLVVTVAPLLVYYALNDQSTVYMVMVVVAVLLQNWILRENKKKQIGVHLIGLKPYVEVLAPIFIGACVIIAMVWNGFHGLQAFDLNFLYAMRENATYPPLLPYFLSWITSLLIPFFLAYALRAQKYIAAIVYSGAALMLYMVMGAKFIYFSLAVIFGLFILTSLKKPVKLLYIGFIILSLFIVVLYSLENGVPDRRIAGLLNSFLGIRFLFIPAQNKFLYYECFSELPKVFFADGRIGSIFGLTNPYNGSLGQTIFAFQGGEMFASNSNTGYFGDSYAQMGFLGVIFTAIILALVLKFFDNCHLGQMTSVFLIAMGVQMIVLNDGAFLTTLLTGGMSILIIFAAVYSASPEIHQLNKPNRMKEM